MAALKDRLSRILSLVSPDESHNLPTEGNFSRNVNVNTIKDEKILFTEFPGRQIIKGPAIFGWSGGGLAIGRIYKNQFARSKKILCTPNYYKENAWRSRKKIYFCRINFLQDIFNTSLVT